MIKKINNKKIKKSLNDLIAKLPFNIGVIVVIPIIKSVLVDCIILMLSLKKIISELAQQFAKLFQTYETMYIAICRLNLFFEVFKKGRVILH